MIEELISRASKQTLCGRCLEPNLRFVDAIAFNLQIDTVTMCNAMNIPTGAVISSIRTIRKHWANSHGFHGFPGMLVYSLWEDDAPEPKPFASETLAAGVFVLLDRAVALERKGRLKYSAVFVEDAVLMLGALRTIKNQVASGVSNLDRIKRHVLSEWGKQGALAKLANDPKQAAKAKVKECWDEWQLKPANYKSKSAFAKDMLDKFEDLDSQAVITRWCGEWGGMGRGGR